MSLSRHHSRIAGSAGLRPCLVSSVPDDCIRVYTRYIPAVPMRHAEFPSRVKYGRTGMTNAKPVFGMFHLVLPRSSKRRKTPPCRCQGTQHRMYEMDRLGCALKGALCTRRLPSSRAHEKTGSKGAFSNSRERWYTGFLGGQFRVGRVRDLDSVSNRGQYRARGGTVGPRALRSDTALGLSPDASPGCATASPRRRVRTPLFCWAYRSGLLALFGGGKGTRRSFCGSDVTVR